MNTYRFIIVLLLGILGSASHAESSATNLWNAHLPYYFTNELVAFTNGQTVLAALKSGDEQSKKQVQALIDSPLIRQLGELESSLSLLFHGA